MEATAEAPDNQDAAEAWVRPAPQMEAPRQRPEPAEPASDENPSTSGAAAGAEQLERGQKVPQEVAASARDTPLLAGAQQELPAMGERDVSAQQAAPEGDDGGQNAA